MYERLSKTGNYSVTEVGGGSETLQISVKSLLEDPLLLFHRIHYGAIIDQGSKMHKTFSFERFYHKQI